MAVTDGSVTIKAMQMVVIISHIFLILSTHPFPAVAQRPLSATNSSLSGAGAMPALDALAAVMSTVRPSLRGYASYSGGDSVGGGTSGSPLFRKTGGKRIDPPGMNTLDVPAPQMPPVDAGDLQPYSNNKMIPGRGSNTALQTIHSMEGGRTRHKDPMHDLRLLSRNKTFIPPPRKIDWQRQGEEPMSTDSLTVLKQENNKGRIIAHKPAVTQMEDVLGVECNFETTCAWTWNEQMVDPFHVVTGANLTASNRTGMMPGPPADSSNDANGHFLHIRVSSNTQQRVLTSPIFSVTQEHCHLEVSLHESGMSQGTLRLVIVPENSQESSWVPAEIAGNNMNGWFNYRFRIGRVTQEFRVLFEVVPKYMGGRYRGHVSIDNMKLKECFPDESHSDVCETAQVKCQKNKRDMCLKTVKVCDIDVDCDDKEDEKLNCDKIPPGGRCDFEGGWCGWQNSGKALMQWERHSGPTPTEKTGPENDHTFQSDNETGHYMYVNMNQHANDAEKKKLVGFASNAVMNSVVFNPPPSVHYNLGSTYRNSCVVRFYFHQFGPNTGSVNLSVVEIREKENVTTTLWWSTKNRGPDWQRENIVMPNITTKYFMQFEARMGMRIYSDVAIDDFSLSPECFGLNIPIDDLDGYNYYDPRLVTDKPVHRDFVNRTVYNLGTCGARGKNGPTPGQCILAYNMTPAANAVRLIPDAPYRGVQVWKAPSENYYTIIAKGAGGGLGSGGVGSSRGALAISVLELHLDEQIFVLVGQKGEHACIKSMGYREKECEPTSSEEASFVSSDSKTKQVKNMVIEDGAGGGGGASFVFVLNAANVAVPLVVAAGGGGLGIGRYLDEHNQHGRLYNPSGNNLSGQPGGDTNHTGGPGGGWQAHHFYSLATHSGASLLEGGRGGEPCYLPRGIHGQGGFGGGGGGCNTGGGGGGYSGGTTDEELSNGNGGTSYISMTRSVRELSAVFEGDNSEAGSVIIIPAIETPACGCDYRCVVLDEYRARVACICPENWRLKKDNLTACEPIDQEESIRMQDLLVYLIIVIALFVIALLALIFILYNRYQRKKQAAIRRKMLLEQDLQLARLRNNPDDVNGLNHFNPNYGCEGMLNGRIDVKTLPQVAREKLNLVKPLGQGAFGEVYQGLYRHRDGDAVEMPVAVKTLPDLSTGQAEDDFLMEAAIMAKFSHPNIVHLIGVCFDRHPRYIVLELLAGGDLKQFLREGRNRPDCPSVLSMKDLMFCALDVAKGCRYMESKRFIHRDIAARNCLLSSKGPGRVVKIADFGMARDIYRSDYYRKGGKAMLPIKWMPPEAFLDGIFTSKTDVWSFGILMWEVFSQGIMPYTSRNNNQVMKFVAAGGRCECPDGCSPDVYRLMRECWNLNPEDRPTFSYLLDQLSACAQEPDIMNAPLAIFIRPPSAERDMTISRQPMGDEEMCMPPTSSSDYLIPLTAVPPGMPKYQQFAPAHMPNGQIPSHYQQQQRQSANSPPTSTHSLLNGTATGGHWETSFSAPNSSASDQNLVSDGSSEERKLILLDTPQQTPTTIKPPSAFGDKDISSNSIATITLDPAHLSTATSPSASVVATSYANVPMMQLPQEVPPPPSQERIDRLNAANRGHVGMAGHDKPTKMPFTIQGFNDRYKSSENHAEISC